MCVEKKPLPGILLPSDSCLGVDENPDLPKLSSYAVTPVQPFDGLISSSTVLTWIITPEIRLRNIDPISIGYAFRPHLRSRLTLPGRAVCRNPWAYGEGDSHPFYRYSYQQQLLSCLHQCSRSGFSGLDNAPLPRQRSSISSIRSFGSTLQPRYVFGATSLDQ